MLSQPDEAGISSGGCHPQETSNITDITRLCHDLHSAHLIGVGADSCGLDDFILPFESSHLSLSVTSASCNHVNAFLRTPSSPFRMRHALLEVFWSRRDPETKMVVAVLPNQCYQGCEERGLWTVESARIQHWCQVVLMCVRLKPKDAFPSSMTFSAL